MNYRGMQVTGRDPDHGTEAARGWPAKAGSADLVAAAQHFDRMCPGLGGIVMYGVSMGANMTGLAVAAGSKRADGRPLFDYWIAIEGVHNVIESYQVARAFSPVTEFAAVTRDDIEREMGGPFETRAATYAERTNVNRVADVAASGVRGVILVHAFENGTVHYNQSLEMTLRLRDAGVPTDLYSVGGSGAGEPGTTIGGYAGVQTGNAGHGWEGSTTHVVIQSGFDRLNALITRGEPTPCNRDFRIDDRSSNISPEPRVAPASCKPGPLPPTGQPGAPCRDMRASAAVAVRVARRGRTPTFNGRAADRDCGRVARVLVAVARREGRGRCRFLGRHGRLGSRRPCRGAVYLKASGHRSWHLRVRRPLPDGHYFARAVAIDTAGRRSPAGPLTRFAVR
jgi:hypothetical protein